MNTIAIIGGDNRQVYLKNKLINDGYSVCSYGLTDDDSLTPSSHDIFILPIPSLYKSGNIYAPLTNAKICFNDIKPILDKAKLVISAKLENYTDICQRDDFCYYNAVPTAEGAIKHLLENTPFALYKKKVLVVGFGKVAKVLISRLLSFGCNITATYRRVNVCAEIESFNINALSIRNIKDNINQFDVIINTVEAPVLTADILPLCKKDVYISELASNNAGVDIDFAHTIGLNAFSLPGIPGKTAPETAGEILYKTVLNVFYENDIKG